MAVIKVNTRFDIGESVYGFAENELHNLVIDRIEVSLARYRKDNPYNNIKVTYLATPTDAKFNVQQRYAEGQLFTKGELINYVAEYFNK